MKDQYAILNARTLWRSQGHCADGARLVVFLDPTVYALLNARPYFRGPSLRACAGGFAFLQGEHELDALAIDDIEHARFPGVRRWDGRLAWGCFVLVRLLGQRTGLYAGYAGAPDWRSPAFARAEPLLGSAAAPPWAKKFAAAVTAPLRFVVCWAERLLLDVGRSCRL